ncbi:MAG: sterol desaturase family protein [Erythrobacter sp.]|jgi:sterol desaturase/sphingolipid hydroxylase (fatty acid hydroxylase superfamily)|nr:sterol desaturase family protein [Erythrobacter sp.]
MTQLAGELLANLHAAFTSPTLRVFPIYLLVTFALGAAIHRYRKIKTPLLGWLVPRSIYLHPSHLVDLKIFLFGRIVAALGVFQVVAVASFLAAFLASLGPTISNTQQLHPLVTALLLLAVADFSTYWVHRAHHQSRIIWPFHALHHSAEVLTPLTLYRKHPIYDLISAGVRALLLGLLQGCLLLLIGQQPTVSTIAGANLFYVLFNLTGANLRHTHVWLSYGPLLEHVLISPAQHQIHHSRAPQHHDRNYGEVFAIWDWMFGTLYVPRENETIEFGLADEHGNPLPQRHVSLATALAVPVADSLREAAGIVKRCRSAEPAHSLRPREQAGAMDCERAPGIDPRRETG